MRGVSSLVHASLGPADDYPLEDESAHSQGSSVHKEASNECDQEAEEACPRACPPEKTEAIRSHHSLCMGHSSVKLKSKCDHPEEYLWGRLHLQTGEFPTTL